MDGLSVGLFDGLTIDLVKVVVAEGQTWSCSVDKEIDIVHVFAVLEVDAHGVGVGILPMNRVETGWVIRELLLIVSSNLAMPDYTWIPSAFSDITHV